MARNKPENVGTEVNKLTVEQAYEKAISAPAIIADKAEVKKPTEPVEKPNIVVKKYRVERGGFVMVNGCRTSLRTGKIIRECDYDLQSLFDQGVILEEIPTSDRLIDNSSL